MLDKGILIFGGTSEGRKLAEMLAGDGIKSSVCVATEYGEELFGPSEYISVIRERMDLPRIEKFLKEGGYKTAVDATHPYADEISKNVKEACGRCGVAYMRLSRGAGYSRGIEDVIEASDAESAAKRLNGTDGNIFLAIGSRELLKFCSKIDDIKRVVARVLPVDFAIKECRRAGLLGSQIIAMQGPFSEEMNMAMFRSAGAKYLVTKDGGREGGFFEKTSAARRLGMKIVLMERPGGDDGYSLDEIYGALKSSGRNITLIGAGMGNEAALTMEAKAAIDAAELTIGSKRLVDALAGNQKNTYAEYDAVKIREYIDAHPEFKNIAILLSGDPGFYSGAKKLVGELDGYGARIMPGISSISYFAARLMMDWQDMKIISLHGRTQNVISAIGRNEKTFVLLGKGGVSTLAGLCEEYGLEGVTMHIGENLGSEGEKITSGAPKDFVRYVEKGPCAAIVINRGKRFYAAAYGMDDGSFIRGGAPMTKEEIRAISISKLAPKKDSIIYDVGAGTGSVAVECALQAYDGKVYAIEKNEDVAKIIERNKHANGAFNLEIVRGGAPEAMEELEAPTHVFIGGSSGKISSIVDKVLKKNKNARIVINAITLETIIAATKVMDGLKPDMADVVCASISKSKKAGNYRVMSPLTPVWIFTMQNKESL